MKVRVTFPVAIDTTTSSSSPVADVNCTSAASSAGSYAFTAPSESSSVPDTVATSVKPPLSGLT